MSRFTHQHGILRGQPRSRRPIFSHDEQAHMQRQAEALLEAEEADMRRRGERIARGEVDANGKPINGAKA